MMEVILSGLMVILSMLMVVLFIAIFFLPLIFWILMLVDCAKRKFDKDNDRVLWIVVIAVFGIVGAIVYYFAIKIKDNKKKKKA